MTRVRPAVPEVPRISIGTQMCLSMSMTRPTLQGASTYSKEKRPWVFMFKVAKAPHIMISASMKFGVPTPIYDRNVKK